MLELFIGSIFLSNVTLNNYLGLRLDKKSNVINILTSIVAFISSIANYYLYKLLIDYKIDYLKNIVFILVIFIVSYLICLIYNKKYKDSIIPIIMTNSFVLGISLIVNLDYNIYELLVYNAGITLGYILIMWLINYLNNEFNKRKVLVSFRGYPIILITLSILYILLGRM